MAVMMVLAGAFMSPAANWGCVVAEEWTRAGIIRDVSSRRGGRRHNQKQRDRSLGRGIPDNSRTATRVDTDESAAEQQPPTSVPVPVDAVLLVADPRYVQPATLTGCDVPSCTSAAVPDEWALLDLDTGNELPYRLCAEHELAWMRRHTPR